MCSCWHRKKNSIQRFNFSLSKKYSSKETSSIIHRYHPDVKVILSTILPRDNKASIRRGKIHKTNRKLKEVCENVNNVYCLEHDDDWIHDDGSLDDNMFHDDNLHIIKKGMRNLR